MHEVPVVFVGQVLEFQFSNLEPFCGDFLANNPETVDGGLLLHRGGRGEMLPVEIDVDGVGHTGCSFAFGIITAVGLVVEFIAAAIIAGNDNSGIADVALGAVVVHVLGPADAGLHAGIADRGFDHIERGHLMVVDLDVFLAAGKEEGDKKSKKE